MPKETPKLKLESMPWFAGYQSLIIKGKRISVAWRDRNNDRIDKLLDEDFRNKTILDVGCNIGSLCILSADRGASVVVGVDCVEETIRNARLIAKEYNYDISYGSANVLNPDFLEKVRAISKVGVFDTVFFMSVYLSIDKNKPSLPPDNPQEVFDRLSDLTKKVLYFEGHIPNDANWYRAILKKHLDNFSIEYLGENRDYGMDKLSRPLFRCVRN